MAPFALGKVESRHYNFTENFPGFSLLAGDLLVCNKHGSGKRLFLKGNYYWRDPFLTSMFMGGRVLVAYSNWSCNFFGFVIISGSRGESREPWAIFRAVVACCCNFQQKQRNKSWTKLTTGHEIYTKHQTHALVSGANTQNCHTFALP